MRNQAVLYFFLALTYFYDTIYSKMNKDTRARSFVAIMITIALSALVLRFATERIIKFSIAQNESYASETLKLLSAALDNYAKDHLGTYPASISVLTQSQPSYLGKDYLAQSPIKGYDYDCLRLEASGYSCSAQPVKCGLTGNRIYTMSTGAVLVSEECGKKG